MSLLRKRECNNSLSASFYNNYISVYLLANLEDLIFYTVRYLNWCTALNFDLANLHACTLPSVVLKMFFKIPPYIFVLRITFIIPVINISTTYVTFALYKE